MRVAAALSLIVSMAACSAGGNNSASGGEQPAFRPSSAVDDARWKPSSPVKTVTMTDEEKAAARIRQLDESRKGHGVPEMQYPSLVRWIYPEEIASVMVPCMKEKGFSVSPANSGTGIKGGAGGQDAAFGKAVVECEAQYSVDPRLTVLPQEHVLSVQYDYEKEFLFPCLRQHGVTVADLPSKQVYVTRPHDIPGYPVGNDEVEKACPYNAPTRALLGDNG